MAKKPKKPVAMAKPETQPSNVKFDVQAVTVIAAAGCAIEQAAKVQNEAFTDAATCEQQ